MVKTVVAGLVLVVVSAPAAALAQTSRRLTSEQPVNVSIAANVMRDSEPETHLGARLTVAKRISETAAVIAEGAWLPSVSIHYLNSSHSEFARNQDMSVLGGVRLQRPHDSFAPFFQGSAGWARRRAYRSSLDKATFAYRTDVGVDIFIADGAAFRISAGLTFLNADVIYRNQFGATAGITFGLGKK